MRAKVLKNFLNVDFLGNLGLQLCCEERCFECRYKSFVDLLLLKILIFIKRALATLKNVAYGAEMVVQYVFKRQIALSALITDKRLFLDIKRYYFMTFFACLEIWRKILFKPNLTLVINFAVFESQYHSYLRQHPIRRPLKLI